MYTKEYIIKVYVIQRKLSWGEKPYILGSGFALNFYNY